MGFQADRCLLGVQVLWVLRMNSLTLHKQVIVLTKPCWILSFLDSASLLLPTTTEREVAVAIAIIRLCIWVLVMIWLMGLAGWTTFCHVLFNQRGKIKELVTLGIWVSLIPISWKFLCLRETNWGKGSTQIGSLGMGTVWFPTYLWIPVVWWMAWGARNRDFPIG